MDYVSRLREHLFTALAMVAMVALFLLVIGCLNHLRLSLEDQRQFNTEIKNVLSANFEKQEAIRRTQFDKMTRRINAHLDSQDEWFKRLDSEFKKRSAEHKTILELLRAKEGAGRSTAD